MNGRASSLQLLLAGSGLAFSLAAACGENPSASAGSGGTSAGDQGEGGGLLLGLGGMNVGNPGGAGSTDLGLEVSAEQQELEVTGEPATVQLSVHYEDGSTPN